MQMRKWNGKAAVLVYEEKHIMELYILQSCLLKTCDFSLSALQQYFYGINTLYAVINKGITELRMGVMAILGRRQ